MGTIPAPNIADQGGEIAAAPMNAYSEYQRAAQLKQATAVEAQQAQGLALDNRVKQQQAADSQALTKAMQEWDGKDFGTVPDLVRKNGGSYNAYQGALQQVTARKTALAALDKDQLANMAAHHDAALGVIDSAKQVPDEQLSQHLVDSAQQLAANGHLTPQEAQALIQHAQSTPAAELRPWVDIFEKSIQGEKSATEQAKTIAETNEKNAAAAKDKSEGNKADIEAGWKEAGPGMLVNVATGETKGNLRVPVDQQELSAYLKNPDVDKAIPLAKRDAATFATWKAKQNPTALVMGNQLGGGGQGSALDQAAERYSKDGSLPAGFSRSPGTTAAIIKRSADLHPDQDIASNKATFTADSAALKKVQTQFEQVNAFEGTALKNLDLYVEKARAIPDLGVRFANVPLRMITKDMIGEKNFAAMDVARQTAFTEAAKVLNSATGAGVLSDSARKELDDVMSGNLPLAATIEVVNTLKRDLANRHASYQEDINAIRGRLGAKPQSEPGGGAAGKIAIGSTIVQNGHRYKVTAVDQNGKPTAADSLP